MSRDILKTWRAHNLYAYVRNKPVSSVDPSGLQEEAGAAAAYEVAALLEQGYTPQEIAEQLGLALWLVEQIIKNDEHSKRCQELGKKKSDSINLAEQLGKCIDDLSKMSCLALRLRAKAWKDDATDRWNYDKECWGGGDAGHIDEQQKAYNIWKDCENIIKCHCKDYDW